MTTHVLTPGDDEWISAGGAGDIVEGLAGDDYFDLQDTYGVTIRAGSGDDTVKNSSDNDRIFLGAGDDRVSRNEGSGYDTISGGHGNDVIAARGRIFGDAGDDRLLGESGSRLSGGDGADVFSTLIESDPTPPPFEQIFHLVIGDFERGQDKFDPRDLAAWYAVELEEAIDLVFIGAGTFDGTAGQVRVFNNVRGGSRAEGDFDGDGEADLIVIFRGVSDLQESDFLL